MGVGNTYLCVLYENGVRTQDLDHVLLPGAPIWDTQDPAQAQEIQLALDYNQQVRLEVTLKYSGPFNLNFLSRFIVWMLRTFMATVYTADNGPLCLYFANCCL